MSIEAVKNLVNMMVRPLRNRVYTMITRAVLETADDSDGMQVVKLNLLAGETRDKVERFQNFGFTSNPPANSECVALAIGGNRDHLIVVVAGDRASRIKNLETGEAAFHNIAGDHLTFKNTGTLEGEVSKNVELTIAENMELVLKKIKIENDQGEVIDLLVQTLTALAAEPFIVNKGTFTAIKTKLESFKV